MFCVVVLLKSACFCFVLFFLLLIFIFFIFLPLVCLDLIFRTLPDNFFGGGGGGGGGSSYLFRVLNHLHFSETSLKSSY